MLEVFHLLHCLNSLRKATYKEYYIKEWEKAGERAMRAHNGMFFFEEPQERKQNEILLTELYVKSG
jgi:hypothetical protein